MTAEEIAQADEALGSLKPGSYTTSFHSNPIAAWNAVRRAVERGGVLHASFVRPTGDHITAITIYVPA